MRSSCLVMLPALALAALSVTTAAVTTAAVTTAANSSPYATLAAKDDLLVTVQFVLKVKMEGVSTDRELDGEITCVTIDPKGLVLCSNTELGGYVSLMSQMMGGGAGFNVTATPTDLRVSLAGQAAEYGARLLARDSDRDLAWLQVDGLGETQLPYLDLTVRADLAVGETFYTLRRMDKFFGREPLVQDGRVAAITRKPRRLLVPSEPTNTGFGVPAFTAGGELVGVTVLQMPGLEDQAQGMFENPLSFLGQSTRLQDMVGGLILPAEEIAKATQLARESMARAEDEDAGE